MSLHNSLHFIPFCTQQLFPLVYLRGQVQALVLVFPPALLQQVTYSA